MTNRTLTSGRQRKFENHADDVLSPESLEAYMAITQLRRFAKYLQTFPQVEVSARFGAAGASQTIEHAKKNGLHPDIVVFHSLMDGCYFRWGFRGDETMLRKGVGGSIEIPTLDQLLADQSQHGIECNRLDRVQVVDRAALRDGSDRFPFYLNDHDQLYAFDGNNADYCPGSLALLIIEGILRLFSPQWLMNYGELVSADQLGRAHGVEAENRRQLQAFSFGRPSE